MMRQYTLILRRDVVHQAPAIFYHVILLIAIEDVNNFAHLKYFKTYDYWSEDVSNRG